MGEIRLIGKTNSGLNPSGTLTITANGLYNVTNYAAANVKLPVTYGVQIDLSNSNPETSLVYIGDATNYTKSYMDFTNDTFVWGSWQDKWPFNEIRPCYMENGAVTHYLDPDNYAQDTDGNAVDITSTGNGDVMIEIPKIYYKLTKDSSYQYIQISDMAQPGFVCLAHTYKGVEKDKVYVGAYQSYKDSNNKTRSISGVSGTEYITLNNWRTYSEANGTGYENTYWNLLVLLQCLYVIQFKNLDSQTALGYGWCNNSSAYSTGGGLNTKGLYYGTSSTGQMKCFGIEDLWGSRLTVIDGAFMTSSGLTIADATSSSMSFSDTNSYILAESLTNFNSAALQTIAGSNLGGFVFKNDSSSSGSTSTYYCDWASATASRVPSFGGCSTDRSDAGCFCLYFLAAATSSASSRCCRLAYCG